MNNRKIELEFLELDMKITATLCEEEPELCNMLWERIEAPLKTTCHNTLSTGDLFVSYPRPNREPIESGSQAKPIGRKLVRFDDLEAGMIVYSGSKIFVAYGEHLTEPLSSSGSIVATVDREHIANILKAGQHVWHAHSVKHKFLTLVIKRK